MQEVCARKRFKHSNCCVRMYSKGLTTSALAWLLSYWLADSFQKRLVADRYHLNNMQ